MKRKISFLITYGLFAGSSLIFQSCDSCKVDPDLITDLVVPTVDIIQGEPVDLTYVVKSVEDNSEECSILQAAASIGQILIDYFVDQNDNDGDGLLDKKHGIATLDAGGEQSVEEQVDVFNSDGLYLISATSDVENDVKELREDNNTDVGELNLRGTATSEDIFKDASQQFKDKLERTSAIIVVGNVLDKYGRPELYKGKPIYYAK